MRFNKQELSALASQTSQNFDREGIIVIKERQDGFFRRTEGCCDRWFRLKGNLLFYLRGTEQLSEPMGVIILGHHQIKVMSQDENGHWPFQIVWENGVCYKMATYLESERTMWIKAIDSAPYNVVQAKICDLKEKISKLLPTIDVSMWRRQRGVVVDVNEVPLCELAISCDNLLCDAHGSPPSPLVVLYVKISNTMFIRYGCTEVVDRCSNPSFSKTILFRACDSLSGDTVVRIVVYDVREIFSETMVPLGYVTILLNTIQEAQRLRIALTSNDKKQVGFITLNGWSLEPSYIGTSPSHCNDRNSVAIPQKIMCHRRSQSLPPRLGVKLKFPSIGTILKQNFVNSHQVTYRFNSGLGGDITVHEIMAECRLCFQMPLQLLDIFIRREKDLLQDLLSLGEMSGQWRNKQFELISIHTSVLKRYWQAKKSLRIYSEDKYFKESCKKDEASLEFAPVNLHLQRMWVYNDTLNKAGFHDIVTAGAFAVHQNKAERTGGLIRLVQQVKDINDTSAAFISATSTKIQSDYETIVAVKQLQDECAEVTQTLFNAVENMQLDRVAPLLDSIESKTKDILKLWEAAAVDEALAFINSNKASNNLGVNDGKPKNDSTIEKLTEQLHLLEMNSELDGNEFSSSCSSKDASPTVDGPLLSASVPNINRNPSKHQSMEGRDMHFINDYFKPESTRENTERCSSLRITKRKMEELQSKCLESNGIRKSRVPIDLRSYFKGSSLDQVTSSKPNVTAANPNNERVQCRGAGVTGGATAALAADVRDRLSAFVDATNALHIALEAEERVAAVSEVRACGSALGASLSAALGAWRGAHAAARLRCEAAGWARAAAALQTRRDACLSQALTTACAGLVCWLGSSSSECVSRLLRAGLGPLCAFEGLLSLFGDEVAMWGDMVVAVEDLHTVRFTLVTANHCGNMIPQVRGSRGALQVLLPVSDALYHKIDNCEQRSFSVTGVLFNVGVNAKAAAAEALGEAAPQHRSNRDSCERLRTYYDRYRKIFTHETNNHNIASSRNKPLEEVMENLRIAVHKQLPKNVEVLHLAALATRLMNGIRFTSCKSAKDRTGMSATLEQSRVLAAEYHLADHQLPRALSVMRSEGCRRENTLKNIGVNKYAFTKKTVAGLPPEYRPPPGTYGSTTT